MDHESVAALWSCASEGFVWASFTGAVTQVLRGASRRQHFSHSLPLILLSLFLCLPHSHDPCGGAAASRQRAERACIGVAPSRTPRRIVVISFAVLFLFWHARSARFRFHLSDAPMTRRTPLSLRAISGSSATTLWGDAKQPLRPLRAQCRTPSGGATARCLRRMRRPERFRATVRLTFRSWTVWSQTDLRQRTSLRPSYDEAGCRRDLSVFFLPTLALHIGMRGA